MAVADLLQINPAKLMPDSMLSLQNMSPGRLGTGPALNMETPCVYAELRGAFAHVPRRGTCAVHHTPVRAGTDSLAGLEHLRWILHKHVRMTTLIHLFFFFAFMQACHSTR